MAGELRNGDKPAGKQISRHLRSAFQALPEGVEKIYARADSGFYCWEAVEAYQQAGCQFIIVARKTARLVEKLKSMEWKPSPETDADGQCEFLYQPDGWGNACRFVALRYGAADRSPVLFLRRSGAVERVYGERLQDPERRFQRCA